MNRIKIAKILGVLVGLAGLVVVLGWVFDIALIKHVVAGYISMKFSTALCFFLSGLALYLIAGLQEKDSILVSSLVFLAILCIVVFMETFLVGSIFKIYTGVEDLFVKDAPGAADTMFLGRPSVGTMIEFTLIAIAGIISLLATRLKELKFTIVFAWCIGFYFIYSRV